MSNTVCELGIGYCGHLSCRLHLFVMLIHKDILAMMIYSSQTWIAWDTPLQNLDNSILHSTSLDIKTCKQLVSHCNEWRVPLAHRQSLNFSNYAWVRIIQKPRRLIRNSKLHLEIQNSTSKFKAPLRNSNSKSSFEFWSQSFEFRSGVLNFNVKFWISKWSFEFRNRVLNFEVEFWILKSSFEFQNRVLNFKVEFWISNFLGFHRIMCPTLHVCIMYTIA
jgi:hypothetical protein